jgi:hypothetical protein
MYWRLLHRSIYAAGIIASLTACSMGGAGTPAEVGQGTAARASARGTSPLSRPPDQRDLARYSAQLALTVLDFYNIDLGFIGSLLSPPQSCYNDRTFSTSGHVVTVTLYGDTNYQCAAGTAEETAAYTISVLSPFTSTFASTATAGGTGYGATGSLTLSSNTLPFTYQWEVGQPTWGSTNASNAQSGLTLAITGSGTIGGTLKATGGSGTLAKAFNGTQAAAGTGVGKGAKTSIKVTVSEKLYESASQSITIANGGSGWAASGGTPIKGASVKATFVTPSGTNGNGGSIAFTYKNPKDPLFPTVSGTVTAKAKPLYSKGFFIAPGLALVQNGKTIATLNVNFFGYGTITYFDNSVEYVTDWTIQQGS